MTKAVTLAELADQNVLTATDNKVGIATTNPQSTLQVGTGITMNGNTGVITAQAYYGDGSNLTGVDSTALKDTNDTVRVQATTTGATITGDLAVDNISVGGTITYDDVTNVDSIGIVTARSGIDVTDGVIKVGTAITMDSVSGVITATKFSGDGSGLIGVASTDNIITGTAATFNSVVKVGTGITMDATSGIITATAFHGDGSNLTFPPKIIAFDPAALSTGVAADTNITITFDQDIEFYGTGTIELRSTSASGTVIEDFNINGPNPPSGLSISGTQLIINPTSNLSDNTVVYVILPVQGIRATSGEAYYAGSSNYNFRTVQQTFSAEGGDFVYTVQSNSSPTNYYKYHIFTSRTGILTTNAPSASATHFEMLMVAGGGGGGAAPTSGYLMGGGGGGGGVITRNGTTLAISAGTYPIGVGTGGGQLNYTFNGNSYRGGSTVLYDSTNTALLTAIGGGSGAYNTQYNPEPGSPREGQPGGSGGGSTGPPNSTSGGTGVNGQGYPGGPANGQSGGTGGGGGAGGAGQSGTFTPGPNAATGGAGGPGLAVPAFGSPFLTGYVNIFPGHTTNEIGPQGYYGGGGGGTYNPSIVSTPVSINGAGGVGGGGDGSHIELGGNPVQDGAIYTGGGGGGNGDFPGSLTNGGDGVVMVRYSVPAP